MLRQAALKPYVFTDTLAQETLITAASLFVFPHQRMVEESHR